MAQFLSKLETQLVDQQEAQGRGTWRVMKPFVYQSDLTYNPIIVQVGFVTDYATVPRIPIIFDLVGDTATEAAVVHDYLYSIQMLSRSESDSIFREAAITCGCPKWQSWILYFGVRIGGWYFWNQKTNK